jgi:hypothetical protein
VPKELLKVTVPLEALVVNDTLAGKVTELLKTVGYAERQSLAGL